MDNQKIFSGLTVLELSSVLAGPAAGMFFAELGARVIKVENVQTNGDVTRSWKMAEENAESTTSAYYHAVNWNKEVHLLDLTNEKDKSQVHQWVSETDIVISNFKHGSAGKLGMDYATLSQLNPGIIYGSISAYGKDDPRPGFDVSMQAETGWVYMNGDQDGPPTKMPVALIDILAAHQLKEGLLIALMQRNRDGKGCEVHVSLFKSSISSLANQASNWLNLNLLPARMGSQHPNIAPYGDILKMKDGLEVMLTAGTQKQFAFLCKALEKGQLTEEALYATNIARVSNRQSLLQLLQEAALERTFEELKKVHSKIGSVMVPIQSMQQVFQSRNAQEMILSQKEPDGSESLRVSTVAFEIE